MSVEDVLDIAILGLAAANVILSLFSAGLDRTNALIWAAMLVGIANL